MAGVMVLLLGLARLGSIIKFIPAPVIVGVTAGIGLIIFVGQWKDFFGLPAPFGTHFHEQLPELLTALPGLRPATTALAAASLLVVMFASRVPGLKRVPGPLAALLFATALQSVFAFEDVATIGTAFGGVPSGLPAVGMPDVTAARVIELMGPAFTIAMLCAIESLLSAVVADGMAGTRDDSNQELVGQGLANIATPFFGGFAATGAIARTATNVRNGGTSPLAGIVHAATLVLVYKAEGPFFFGAVENFERALAFTHTDPRVLIIRLRWVPFMDITGVQALEEAIRDLHRRSVRVVIAGANPRVAAKLEKVGGIALIGRENFRENIVEALAACRATSSG
jgi:MFS superfamily sulfate permease-like transporter